MDLEQATYHAKETEPLKLKEVYFKVIPEVNERKRLFRKSLYELTLLQKQMVRCMNLKAVMSTVN